MAIEIDSRKPEDVDSKEREKLAESQEQGKKISDKKKIRFSKRHCIYILRKAGAVQIRDEAKEELQVVLEDYALDVSRCAVLFADDRAHYRLNREDIKNAVKEYRDHFQFRGS